MLRRKICFCLIVLSLASLSAGALDINGGKMNQNISITVGTKDADIIGSDNRALQAAIDYVGMLGGGTIKILAGTYSMKDSLHLRSNITIIGEENTILKKCDSHKSLLVTDGDYGEEQITVADASGFEVGMGVTVHDDNAGGFHTTVATIIASEEGNVFVINNPLLSDCMVRRNAIAKTTFPVISGYYVENIKLEKLTIDGNRENNEPLNGCRGAGIFLYRAKHVNIENCVTQSYNGDGVSFQQSNDIIVENCVSHHNANLGFHPGSGSQRPTMRNNTAYNNGGDGLFLCWRVRHGLFEGNELKDNERHGISIGHKDSDNILRNNIVTGNHRHGIYFRDEPKYTGGHRNLLENNIIHNNGVGGDGCGIYVDGETEDTIIKGNAISDIRPEGQKTQRFGIFVGSKAVRTTIQNNTIEGNIEGNVRDESVDSK